MEVSWESLQLKVYTKMLNSDNGGVNVPQVSCNYFWQKLSLAFTMAQNNISWLFFCLRRPCFSLPVALGFPWVGSLQVFLLHSTQGSSSVGQSTKLATTWRLVSSFVFSPLLNDIIWLSKSANVWVLVSVTLPGAMQWARGASGSTAWKAVLHNPVQQLLQSLLTSFPASA